MATSTESAITNGIVVDINAFAAVFDSSCRHYEEFKYVSQWIMSDGSGATLVYGGSRYRRELGKSQKYLTFVKLLKDSRKVAEINDQMVDQYERSLNSIKTCKEFDDKHLVAIIAVSNCRLLCSEDSKSYKYIKNLDHYTNGSKPPSIYTGSRNRNLLDKWHLAKLRNVI